SRIAAARIPSKARCSDRAIGPPAKNAIILPASASPSLRWTAAERGSLSAPSVVRLLHTALEPIRGPYLQPGSEFNCQAETAISLLRLGWATPDVIRTSLVEDVAARARQSIELGFCHGVGPFLVIRYDERVTQELGR